MKLNTPYKEKLEKEIEEIQYKMQIEVHDVKLEFYRMIKNILLAYSSSNIENDANYVGNNLLIKFKGCQTESGHILQFFKW